jgi:hypothetical protein
MVARPRSSSTLLIMACSLLAGCSSGPQFALSPPTATVVPGLRSSRGNSELVSSGSRTRGPGRLGKQYLALSVTGDRSPDQDVRQTFGTPLGYEAELNIPVNSLTDFRLWGRYVHHSNDYMFDEIQVVRSIVEGGSVAAGLRHRLSSSPKGSPFVSAMLGYTNGDWRFANPENISESIVRDQLDNFSWQASVGGEAQLGPTLSILLGVGAGNTLNDGLDDVSLGVFGSAPLWLSANFFIAPRAEYDLDEHLRYGIDVGFGF